MKVVIAGAGASGMMAGIAALDRGHEVIILEKNDIPGRKLYITGKGRCNVTNAADTEDLIQAVMHNREFMYSSFYTFTNRNLMELMEKGGLRLKEERGRRVFPQSDKSSDIIRFFRRQLEDRNADLRFGYRVEGLIIEKGRMKAFRTNRGNIEGDHFIIAAGGGSYPLTGSDGAMLGMLSKAGIETHSFRPSLIPMVLTENVVSLAGLALKNVTFTLFAPDGKRKVYSDLGEMMFTHDGISGPLVLTASTLYEKGMERCEIDLKPGMSEGELDARLLRDFKENLNKDVLNALHGITVQSLIPSILSKAGIEGDRKVNSITREERLSLVSSLKHYSLTIKGLRPLPEAIISRGGVDVDEIDPSTMKLKKLENVSVCGEIIDVDAQTGGYNLQIAFSTGFLAGDSI